MTLTAFVGALVALLPRPEKPAVPVADEVGRLTRDNIRLTRSHARLVDHIGTLEREILIEQHLCAHWKQEAQRLATQAIAARERAEQQAQQNVAMGQPGQGFQQQAFGGCCNCVPSRARVWHAR